MFIWFLFYIDILIIKEGSKQLKLNNIEKGLPVAVLFEWIEKECVNETIRELLEKNSLRFSGYKYGLAINNGYC